MVIGSLIEHADGRKFIRIGECDSCRTTKPGQCCTFVQLPLARMLSTDEVKWVELHPGLRVSGQSIRIEVACSALDGALCSLFGKPERPALCERYPEEPAQLLAG